MNDEMTVFTLDDGNYLVLDKIKYNDKLFLYLFNEANPEDFIIQEYNGQELLGVDSDTYDTLLVLFTDKHKR